MLALKLAPPWASDLGPPQTQPQNSLLGDEGWICHPWLLFTRQELAAGRFPFWNPLVAGGTPFFAANLPGLLSPFT